MLFSQRPRFSRRWVWTLPFLALALFVAGWSFLLWTRALAQAPADQGAANRPPLTPRWVFEPWVWEDEANTAQAVRDLVDGYQSRGIPVGAVIVDSPWATNYNTFTFGPDYPNPSGLIQDFHSRGVRVVLWTTSFLNVSSVEGPGRGKATNYDEAFAADYLLESGRVYRWSKGRGSVLDFFNPAAVQWWYGQLDQVWSLGIDGWKVDNGENNLPEEVNTFAGRKTRREYGEAYYRAFHRYVSDRGANGTTFARPYAFESTDFQKVGDEAIDPAEVAAARARDEGVVYAPVEVSPASWVGDQSPDWDGLDEALDNLLVSAARGYSVVGSDIGGYLPGRRIDKLMIRWAQLGSLSPLMENGGRGEHRPWRYGSGVVENYRYYARLHSQLVPYLYSASVEAHRGGPPIIREGDRQRRQYLLGSDLLVAPIVGPADEREVALPTGSNWHDYWDDNQVRDGGATFSYQTRPDQIPLFIRSGAIIPLSVVDGTTGHGDAASAGRLTVLVYPSDQSSRRIYLDPERSIDFAIRRESASTTLTIGQGGGPVQLRIKQPSAPSTVSLERRGVQANLPPHPTWETFTASQEGWYYDSTQHQLWARLDTTPSESQLRYTTP